jgi:hypothetical protein
MRLIFCCLQLCAQGKDSAMLTGLSKAPRFMRFGKRSDRLVLSLETLHVKDEMFWLRFSLANKSGLSYPVDLFRLYIRDKNHAARSSQQEVELVPVYADTVRIVPAHGTIRFFIGLKKFTIPDNKVCLLEMFEANGGRNLSLEITNRQLFLARPVEEKQIKLKR